jgi:hypothetical protein
MSRIWLAPRRLFKTTSDSQRSATLRSRGDVTFDAFRIHNAAVRENDGELLREESSVRVSLRHTRFAALERSDD